VAVYDAILSANPLLYGSRDIMRYFALEVGKDQLSKMVAIKCVSGPTEASQSTSSMPRAPAAVLSEKPPELEVCGFKLAGMWTIFSCS